MNEYIGTYINENIQSYAVKITAESCDRAEAIFKDYLLNNEYLDYVDDNLLVIRELGGLEEISD